MRLTKARREMLLRVAGQEQFGGYLPMSDAERNVLRDLLLMGYARRACVQDDTARNLFCWFVTDAGRERLRWHDGH